MVVRDCREAAFRLATFPDELDGKVLAVAAAAAAAAAEAAACVARRPRAPGNGAAFSEYAPFALTCGDVAAK